jgi:hypothetical protein
VKNVKSKDGSPTLHPPSESSRLVAGKLYLYLYLTHCTCVDLYLGLIIIIIIIIIII